MIRSLRMGAACARAFACALIGALSGAAALADDAVPRRQAEVMTALTEISAYAGSVLMTNTGQGRADYNMRTSQWLMYETHWHTGQLIWALVEAGLVLDRPDLIGKAELGGNWWISTEYPEGHPFAGLVSAAHGDKLGNLINWTTIADGTPGLFALSRATGKSVYADTATRSGKWLWENTRVPADIEGGAWLFYNIFDPDDGIVYTNWDVHTQGLPRDPEIAATSPAPVTRVARPNIEGFLFADMCRHTDEQAWCERFTAQADSVLARQDKNGLWLDFEPNRNDGSQVHPRFNVWNAEALIEAYEVSGERKFLDAAAKTVRWGQSVMQRDGTRYYDTAVDGTTNEAEVTGSAVAFNGILMLRLKDYGYDEFDDTIETLVDWIIANRFAPDHPDPNLAGAVINIRQKFSRGTLRMINRDVGSTFAMRFLALYLRDLRGEDVNQYLRGAD